MIMVLSCFDLVAIITHHPGIMLYLICWLREDYHSLYTWWMYLNFVVVLLGFSFQVRLVMSIERYLGAFYPIFHRTSVTRRRAAKTSCNIDRCAHQCGSYFFIHYEHFQDTHYTNFYYCCISPFGLPQLQTVQNF